MDDFLIGAYIGVGSALLGALVTYFLSKSLVQQTHRNDLELLKIDEFNKAAAIFRATFVNEIYMLRDNIQCGGGMVHHIITCDTFVAHEKAKIIFEPFLPDDTLRGFNDAWLKYINCEEKNTKVYSPGNIDHRKELSAIHLSHIENLLEYAKPKK